MKWRPYPAYKPSGIDWLGDVPEHWEVKRLKYLVTRKDKKVEADEGNPLPYIGLEHIESWTGRLLHFNTDLIPRGISNGFHSGDTLFGKLRPYLAKACNVDFEGLCSSELLVLRAKDQSQRFLLYRLLAEGFIARVNASTYGAKMPRASWDFIGSCVFPVPPLPEQTAIADFLDRETEKIDTLVAKKQTLIERLKEKRTALIWRTVTRGLPPDEARKAGLDPNPRLKPSGIDWLGDVPEHWEVKRLSHGFKNTGSGTTPPSDDEDWYNGDALWVTTSELRENIIYDTQKKVSGEAVAKFSALKPFPAGSLIIAMYGATIGRLGILGAPATTNQACCVIYGERSIRIRFLFHWFQSFREQIVLLASGGGQANISQEKIRSLRVACPCPSEQTAIADFLDRETAKIDRLISKIETAIDRLREYRTALITAAVTGKIDVRGEGA